MRGLKGDRDWGRMGYGRPGGHRKSRVLGTGATEVAGRNSRGDRGVLRGGWIYAVAGDGGDDGVVFGAGLAVTAAAALVASLLGPVAIAVYAAVISVPV